VAGLRSDQLGELMLSPRPPSGTGGLLLRGGEEREGAYFQEGGREEIWTEREGNGIPPKSR